MTFPGYFSVRVNKNLSLQSHTKPTLFKDIFLKPWLQSDKLQQNQMKPESIRIVFFDLPWQRKKNQRFDKKNPWELKIKREHLFELFSGDLDEKMTLAGYRRKRNKKESETVWRADNLFKLWPSSHSNYKKLTSG